MKVETINGGWEWEKKAAFYQGVKVTGGALVFLSGQGGILDNGKVVDGGLEAQTKLAMDNIKTILEKTGGSMDNIVNLVVYYANRQSGDIKKMSQIIYPYFSEGKVKATTWVEVCSLSDKNMLIEIQATAVI